MVLTKLCPDQRVPWLPLEQNKPVTCRSITPFSLLITTCTSQTARLRVLAWAFCLFQGLVIIIIITILVLVIIVILIILEVIMVVTVVIIIVIKIIIVLVVVIIISIVINNNSNNSNNLGFEDFSVAASLHGWPCLSGSLTTQGARSSPPPHGCMRMYGDQNP